jgi:RimJ/RimL family protein N-acetyltransferase
MLTATVTRSATLHDGSTVYLRPIRPDDGPALVALFGRLSERSIYHRFFTARRSLPDAWVHQLTHVDYDRRLAIVAERDTSRGVVVIGVARYDASGADGTAELALVVEDAWQGRGLGAILLHAIMEAAAAHGFHTFRVEVLTENRPMLRLLARETEFLTRAASQGVIEALVRPRRAA